MRHNSNLFRTATLSFLMSCTCSGTSSTPIDGGADAGSSATTCSGASTQTQAIVDAANAFIATLTPDHATKVQFAFDRPASSTASNYSNRLGEKYGAAQWSNYPVSDIPRPGLAKGTLTDAQQAAETKLLQTALSTAGYEKVLEIMGADQVLADQGQNFSAGTATYTIGIFGPPSATTPWMLEYGGHHLGLNIVIDGARGTVAPTLTGAQPAVYQRSDGTTVRALAAENDKAFALLNALDDTQRAKAILSYTVSDLVLGPGHEGTTLMTEGLQASTMNAVQKAMLMDIIGEWVGILSSAYNCSRLAEIQAGLDQTYFAWSGPTTHATNQNGTSYYRIQGPKVVIEFSPQGVGGNPALHVHTVYRDPTNDYGHTW